MNVNFLAQIILLAAKCLSIWTGMETQIQVKDL